MKIHENSTDHMILIKNVNTKIFTNYKLFYIYYNRISKNIYLTPNFMENKIYKIYALVKYKV